MPTILRWVRWWQNVEDRTRSNCPETMYVASTSWIKDCCSTRCSHNTIFNKLCRPLSCYYNTNNLSLKRFIHMRNRVAQVIRKINTLYECSPSSSRNPKMQSILCSFPTYKLQVGENFIHCPTKLLYLVCTSHQWMILSSVKNLFKKKSLSQQALSTERKPMHRI